MALLTEAPASASREVTLREFQPGDAEDFRRLNEEWITLYFKLEPKDRYVLEHPEETILARGGRILFAVRNGVALGTCALIPIAPSEYEVAKMGVTAAARGMGIGHKLMQCVVATGRALGATRLYLETNHALLPAIRVYTAAGFRDVPKDKLMPSPYERADVFMELFL
jgi:putative acetyltransferase